MKTLNMNSYVRIKLTSYGIEVLHRKHEGIRAAYPFIGKFSPPKTDKDGYYKMQLWQVMNIFGQYMYDGNINLPFELDIQIDDAQFKS